MARVDSGDQFFRHKKRRAPGIGKRPATAQPNRLPLKIDEYHLVRVKWPRRLIAAAAVGQNP